MTPAKMTTLELNAAAARLETAPAESILAWAYDNFSRPTLVASFQAESSVLIDMACRLRDDVRVVTLDTGRLHPETHEVMDVFRARYGIRLQVVAPDAHEIEGMVAEHGVNLFYNAPELRYLCCDVRKSRPLTRALAGCDAWFSGIRRAQATTRSATPVVSEDRTHDGIAKVAPLARWSTADVWEYIERHDVPQHALYARGFTSIGCLPCTRATRPGEDPRAGRWWWEHGEAKECGLHWPNEPEEEGAA